MSRSRICAPYAGASMVLLMLASGCGGSGGGSSGGGSSSGGGVSGRTLTVSETSLDLRAGVTASADYTRIIDGMVSGTGPGTLNVIVTSSAPNVVNVQSVLVALNGGRVELVPGSPSALGVGVHTATVTIQACIDSPTCSRNQINGSPKVINVSYTIVGIQSTVSSLTFDIGNSTVPADLVRTFSVNSHLTEGWTATEDIPFLSLTPGTVASNGANVITASLDSTQFDAYGGGRYSGVIHIAANSPGQLSVDVPVTININRTRVNFVAPYIAQPGRVDEVIIRGESFNAAPPTGVRFGNVNANSFSVVSDTEIRATHPSLAAGTYVVRVDNAQGINRTTAELHVVDAPTFTSTTIEYPDGPQFGVEGLVYDAERQALIVLGLYNQVGIHTERVLRYAHTPTGWQLTASVPAAFRAAIALSTDGRKLFLGRAGGLDELDPMTLAILKSTNNGPEFWGLAVANDGNVIIQTEPLGAAMAYSSLRGTFSVLLQPEPPLFLQPAEFVETGATGASGDGSTVLISRSRRQRTVRYVSGSLTTAYVDTETDRRVFNYIRFNRRGDLMLDSISDVWDGNLTRVGTLPESTRFPVLAPEQPRIYAYDRDGTIHVYDVILSTVGNTITEVMPRIVPVDTPQTDRSMMIISPDGGTLFLAKYERLVIQDIP